MEVINFGENKYYNGSEIFKKDPSFFYGCYNNVRNIIKKKKIKEDDYIWSYKKERSLDQE